MTNGSRAARVKICGVTNVDDAIAAAEEGADYLGFNFVAASARIVTRVDAASMVRDVTRRFPNVVPIAVVADESAASLASLRAETGIRWLQLHGDESIEELTRVEPNAVKAVRIAGARDVMRARSYPGEWVLVDSHVTGILGGSGATFEWALVRDLARERNVMLAGGITPSNAAAAIHAVRPFAIDVASGVERAPRHKDRAAIRALIAAARA